jgi:NAD-dependent deacetylase
VLTVITQNVDDLHQRAGNTDAIRLHGDILADRWLQPCPQAAAARPRRRRPAARRAVPTAATCVRPGVVWFGEMLPTARWRPPKRPCSAAGCCWWWAPRAPSGRRPGWPGQARQRRRAGGDRQPVPSEIDAEAHQLLRGTAAHAAAAAAGRRLK